MDTARPASRVADHPAASPCEAHAHFAARLRHETDVADVAADLRSGAGSFVLLDVRSEPSYARAHVPGALNLPSSRITEPVAASLPPGLLVVYCWSPGCNGAHRAAALLTRHGRQVKEMIGGFEYWVREGQPVEGEDADALGALAQRPLVG